MKIFKSKLFIGIVCLVFAAFVAFVLIPKQSANQGESVEVVRVNKTIKPNTLITEDMLRTETVIQKYIPEQAIREKEGIIGKYAVTMIFPEDYITSGKLSSVATDSELYSLNGTHEYAVSVELSSLSRGVSGKLLPGDVVRVYGYHSESKTLTDHGDLRYVEVLAVSNNKGEDIAAAKAMNDGITDNVIPATVTLKVNETQAKELILMEHQGSLHLAFAGRGDAGKMLLGE